MRRNSQGTAKEQSKNMAIERLKIYVMRVIMDDSVEISDVNYWICLFFHFKLVFHETDLCFLYL